VPRDGVFRGIPVKSRNTGEYFAAWEAAERACEPSLCVRTFVKIDLPSHKGAFGQDQPLSCQLGGATRTRRGTAPQPADCLSSVLW
jgi:hypothetical protein